MQASTIGTCLPTFRVDAADRTRAASMPDTTWPIDGHPPGPSRRHLTAPVSMSFSCFDTSSAVRSRSPSRSPPDVLTARLLLNAHHDGLQPTPLEAARVSCRLVGGGVA